MPIRRLPSKGRAISPAGSSSASASGGPADPAAYAGSGPGVADQALRIGSQISQNARTSSSRVKRLASPRIASRIRRS